MYIRVIAVVALAVSLSSGCANLRYSIERTPERVSEALAEPIRRVHLVTQILRFVSTAGVGIGCALTFAPTIVGMIACPFVAMAYDFILYEYVLDPISQTRVAEGKPSLVAPYWEGGPRTDEGERFSDCQMPTTVCTPPAK